MIQVIRKYRDFIFLLLVLFILYKLVENYQYLFQQVSSLLSLLGPFFWALGIAYLMNPAMVWLEKKFPLHRALVLTLLYLALLGLLSLLVFFLAPVLVTNITDLVQKIPEYQRAILHFNKNLFQNNELIRSLNPEPFFQENVQRYTTALLGLANSMLTSAVQYLINLTLGIFQFLLGIVISVYMLYDKEKFRLSVQRAMKASFGFRGYRQIARICHIIDKIFYQFFMGKALDSTIIGILCWIGLSVIGCPYTSLMSIIVGVFNMIPYFGPFIGAVPAVLVALLASPVKGFIVALFILALQQFDGLYLGPKILGGTVGISPFYIILAIVVGGGYFGILGMLFGVPILKVLSILVEEQIELKLKKDSV